MKQQLLRYWYAMNATALQSAVHAVKIFCGLAGGHQLYETIPTLNLQGVGVVFLIAFGSAILDYIDAHPLPVDLAAPISAPPTATPK